MKRIRAAGRILRGWFRFHGIGCAYSSDLTIAYACSSILRYEEAADKTKKLLLYPWS